MGSPQMMGMGRPMGQGMQGMSGIPGGNMMQPGMNPQNYMQNLGAPGFGMQGFNQLGQMPDVSRLGGMPNSGGNPGMPPSMVGGMNSLNQQMGNMNINQNPMQQMMGGAGSTMGNPMQQSQNQPQPFPNTTYGQGQQAQIDTTPTFKSPSNPAMFNQMKGGPLKNPESHEEWKNALSVLDLNSQCLFIRDNKDSFIKLSETEQSQMLGDLMYALLSRKNFDEETKGNMTSMFIDPEVLSLDEIINMLVDDDVLNERIEEANEILQDNNENEEDN